MRVLVSFDPKKHAQALNQGQAQLWFGTHLPVPQDQWFLFYAKYHRSQKFLVTFAQGAPRDLASNLPHDAICVLEEGDALPMVRKLAGCFAVRTKQGYVHALDYHGEVWPASALRSEQEAMVC